MALNSEFDCGHDSGQPEEPDPLMSVDDVADWLRRRWSGNILSACDLHRPATGSVVAVDALP